jgi:hypothetical protein
MYEFMWPATKFLINLVFAFACVIILLYFFGMFYEAYDDWRKERKFDKYLRERDNDKTT